MSTETTIKHFTMLNYLHKHASKEMKSILKLPDPAYSLDILIKRNLSKLDLDFIEAEYLLLRSAGELEDVQKNLLLMQ